jgi:hypothetical protein
LTQELIELKTFIGHKDDSSIEDVRKAYEDDLQRYSKNADDASKNYRAVVKGLYDMLAKEQEKVKVSNTEKLELEANFKNQQELYKTVFAKYTADRNKAVKDREEEARENTEKLTQQKNEFDKTEKGLNARVKTAEETVKAEKTKADNATIEANQVRDINAGLAEQLDGMRRQNFDRPAGKILSVNQTQGIVVLNLGSEDGLMTRMTFSVYSPKITGISLGSHDLGKDATICEVCKRDIDQSVSKASIEVIRIIAPHKAEARILDDILTDPVSSGDVVYTPIWKPGQLQHFALAAGMVLPSGRVNDGQEEESHLDTIIRLIKSNGGVIDAYMSDGKDGEHARGDIVKVGKGISRDTSFIVVGDIDEAEEEKNVRDNQMAMVKQAKDCAVRQITIRELLSRMGWKNVTPVRGFGAQRLPKDVDITPTGERRPSTGMVSPFYDKYDVQGRVGIEERAGRNISPGIVSPLYSESAVAPTSTGKTSDLFFKPRQPASDEVKVP